RRHTSLQGDWSSDVCSSDLVSEDGYLSCVLMHEVSHELGPAYARRGDRQVDIRESIGPVYSGLEEAKADVVGMYGVKWLADKGEIGRASCRERGGSCRREVA